MIALLAALRAHPTFPANGPEHHALVPAIILATYRNRGGEVDAETIRRGIQRGRQVPGGTCGFFGVCGAAAGVGAAFALILGAHPLAARERQAVMQAGQTVMREMASLQAARCCQREIWTALRVAADLSQEHLPILLLADAPLVCQQMDRNAACAGAACPLAPAAGCAAPVATGSVNVCPRVDGEATATRV